MIQVNNKEFELYVDSKKIESIVFNLAGRLNKDYAGKDPVLIGILNGSFLFIADLVRKLNFDPIVTFTKLASYSGTQSTGQVDELIGLKEDLKGKDVLIIEDIVDTGNTLEKISEILKEKEIASLEIVTLLFKSSIYKKCIDIKYFGLDVPNKFIVGYGLDYDGRGRSLKGLYHLMEG
ncbi:MAG: hypoxanthine phosphoribosyltransferase [Bacteroidia bacterium]|jgi:hypoxanthine phosphoribosyltransferase